MTAHNPQGVGRSPSLVAAEDFILRSARLLERHRFTLLFGRGRACDVISALRPYQNADGGFGNALEPDLRGEASQPVPLEHAFQILDEANAFDAAIVKRGCDWLASVTTGEGGVPFVLPSVVEAPHAPWWVATGAASLNPTAGIVGLLHKHQGDHPWLETATAFCWEALQSHGDDISPDDAISVLVFLEYAPDRTRAEEAFETLGRGIVNELVALDPSATGYVKSPLAFAPHPAGLGRRLFDDATVESHLDELVARQEADGGWPITWEPPSVAAVNEWRGFMTVKWLKVLNDYGRLACN